MKFFDNFFNKIQNFNKKDFLKFSYILIFVILLISGFVVYRYFSKVSTLKKDLKKLNNARQEAQVILSKNIQVQKQKESVEKVIENGKNFKLLQYFDSVTEKLGIQNIKEKEISTSDLENLKEQGYNEVRLTATFSGMNMQKIVQLLDEFEKNERIYTKNLEISKQNDSDAVDVNIVIATLQPKTEITEISE